MKRLVVLLSGTGSLAEKLLTAAQDPGFGAEVVAIGSDRDDAAGLAHAQAFGIPKFVIAPQAFDSREHWDRALAGALVGYSADLVVSAGYMRIFGSHVLAEFPQRIVNSHPALLPSFPGAHAVRDALAYGVKVTGSTIHFVDDGVDTGPVLAQVPVTVEDGDTEETLHERIKQVERELLVRVVKDLCHKRVTVNDRKVILT